jgi:hypothetical protein
LAETISLRVDCFLYDFDLFSTKDLYTKKVIIIYSGIYGSRKLSPIYIKSKTTGGRRIARPKKNKELLIGRAGRNAIECEDIAREALRWKRRKQTIERFSVG